MKPVFFLSKLDNNLRRYLQVSHTRGTQIELDFFLTFLETFFHIGQPTKRSREKDGEVVRSLRRKILFQSV